MRILSGLLGVLLVAGVAVAGPRKAEISLGYDAWSITPAGATHSRPTKYDHRFSGKGWSIDVKEWPVSTVFIQTLDEQLASVKKRDPDLVVVMQAEHTKSDWVLVTQSSGTLHGIVMRPGKRGSNAVCTFNVGKKHVMPALAACGSLEFLGAPKR